MRQIRRVCALLAFSLALCTALALPLSAAGHAELPVLRKVPGPSPKQTIENVLSTVTHAQTVIDDAIRLGLSQPGWTFTSVINQQADEAKQTLEQAGESLDLRDVPVLLRPMLGVADLLSLYSLLRYDLDRHPSMVLPNQELVRAENLRVWSLPDSTIALHQIESQSNIHTPESSSCSQCTPGDFLFTPSTLKQVPSDFQSVFGSNPILRRRYGAHLYDYWALLPGGAIPPKLFFLIPDALQNQLLTKIAGQSILQWILLLPMTAFLLTLFTFWLLKLRAWLLHHQQFESPLIHVVGVTGCLPPILLVYAWKFFAIDWINLFGPRQAGVLFFCSILNGALLAMLSYLAAESVGQFLAWKPCRSDHGRLGWSRRRGSGQIMTLARVAGLVAAISILLHTGSILGVTSVTLLAMSSVPALAISLGTQQLIHDIADGFSLLLDGQIKPGELYLIGTPKSGEIKGRISSLGMRSLRVEIEDGSIVTIPNSQVASSVVTKLKVDVSA